VSLTHVPDLDGLHLLVRVAELGSFGKAAAAHGISQPAVSARIRAMEGLIGVPLLTRSSRGSTLTPAGQLVVQWAREVLTAAHTLGAGIDSLRTDRDGQLKVAASMTIAEYLLPGWLVALSAARPDTRTSLRAMNSAEVAAAVLGGQVDLGFVEGPGVPSGLESKTVALDRLVVVVPPRHPWARPGRTVVAAELAATRLVAREATSGTRTALEAALARFGPPAQPLLELSTSGAVLAAVTAGAGPAVLSELAARDDIAIGRVVEVPVEGISLRRRLRAVWPRGPRPSGPGRELLSIARRG
jgi:DNA-binding transcriptional LysR family regulator